MSLRFLPVLALLLAFGGACASTSQGPSEQSQQSATSQKHFRCEGKTRCTQMSSCEEATFYIKNCPGTEMDGDGDGVPCESQWCGHQAHRGNKIMTLDEENSPVAWSSMAALLYELEEFGEKHSELYDTDVRERMWAVVEGILIKQCTTADVPDELGMFSSDANEQLKQILIRNLEQLRDVFEAFELDTERKRLASFQNERLHTEKGHYVEDFFGAP